MLCTRCYTFTRNVIQQDFSSWEYSTYPNANPSDILTFHHGTAENMNTSAESGCPFCAYLKPAFSSLRPHEFSGETIYAQIESSESVHARGKPKTLFSFQVTNVHKSTESTLITFELFQFASEKDLQGELEARPGRILPFPIASTAVSPWCLSLMKLWLQQCEMHHTTCERINNAPLPTRIIDVGPADGSETPKLHLSKGEEGRYLTLSHCWGPDQRSKTTRHTLDTHLDRIEEQDLAVTFRDAITITRLLGFRYLWIDAICTSNCWT